MFRILKRGAVDNPLAIDGTVFELDGKFYWLSTVALSAKGPSTSDDYESAIFECDKNWENINYKELYSETYSKAELAREGHRRILENLESGKLKLENRGIHQRLKKIAEQGIDRVC
jgi:hypothetical protein